MSWFNIFTGAVVFGELRVCDNSLDWDFTSNAFGYFDTFPDSTCLLQPSEVFSSYQCYTNTTTPVAFQTAGCPDQPLYDLNFKFEQAYGSLLTNFSLNATWGCEGFYMERNASGYTILLTDNPSAPGCSGSTTVSSTSSSTSPSSSATSSSSSISFSNSTTTSTSPTIQESTVLTTTTYTITSCPPAVTNCHSGSVTTQVITTAPLSAPETSSILSESPTTTTQGQTAPTTSATPSTVVVSAGTRTRSLSSGLLFSVLFFTLCTLISPVLCLLDSALAKDAASPRDASLVPNNNNPARAALGKRIPVADFTDIAAFGPPLAAVLQANLPVPSGDPNPLTSSIAGANSEVCSAGRNNAATYGPSWTTAPGKHLLGQMLSACVTAFDQVSLGTYIYASTQSPTSESEEGVVFFKFVGALYCNRLIVTLVEDPANLDKICEL